MLAQPAVIDSTGRIVLPKFVLEALGAYTSDETEVIIELTEAGVIIKPIGAPITERIAAMALPVADWEQMEQEIEAGWTE